MFAMQTFVTSQQVNHFAQFGWIEFEKLWKRCNYIMLDDTLALKHIQTRAFILGNPDKFKVIDDNTRERQGYLVCEVLKID